jgi:hypothetical protein
MSTDEMIKAKMYRLEELKKYQSYYGPNTPYPVIMEINDLEAELRQLMGKQSTRATRVVKKKKKSGQKTSAGQFWQMSRATVDAIATIAFIGLLFLLGSILFAAYMQNRPDVALARMGVPADVEAPPTLRPTFTPTLDPNAPAPPAAEAAAVGASGLPVANQQPTSVPTSVPTMTPSPTPMATETPVPTDTPIPPTAPPPPPTATPAPPTPTPAPSFPFTVVEQGNREFQKTTNHVINIYAAIVSEGNVPIGGLKLVGDHVPSGTHVESGLSDWHWSVVNCLDCDYIKQGNIKFEPGSFSDGTWSVYLADESGAQLSKAVPLSYSTDPDQWVWDFIIFKKK